MFWAGGLLSLSGMDLQSFKKKDKIGKQIDNLLEVYFDEYNSEDMQSR